MENYDGPEMEEVIPTPQHIQVYEGPEMDEESPKQQLQPILEKRIIYKAKRPIKSQPILEQTILEQPIIEQTILEQPIIEPEPIQPEQRQLFNNIEELFKAELLKYRKFIKLGDKSIICCKPEEADTLIQLAKRIKLTKPFNELSNYDLYLTLIYTYYSLLGEQTEDFLDILFLIRNATNKELVKQLYFGLTTGDIIELSGRNLSSDVRRGFFNFWNIGGKRKTKKIKKKTKTQKKRRKSKNKKSYKNK